MNKQLVREILIITLIILIMLLAAKTTMKSCEATLSECNNYIKENCTKITYSKEKTYSYDIKNFSLEITKEKEEK